MAVLHRSLGTLGSVRWFIVCGMSCGVFRWALKVLAVEPSVKVDLTDQVTLKCDTVGPISYKVYNRF